MLSGSNFIGRGIFHSTVKKQSNSSSLYLWKCNKNTKRFYSMDSSHWKGLSSMEIEKKIVEGCFEEKEPRSIPSKSLVGIHGWKKETIVLSSRKLGLPDVSYGLVQQGPLSLVSHFIQQSNLDFINHLESLGGLSYLKSLTPKESVHLVIKSRLSQLAPFVHNWSQAIGLMATPQNASHSLRYISSLVDEIAFLSGDRSTNFDWYTKRATILSIYTATELYMLTDTSQGFSDTWKFLERRIEDAATISQFASKVEEGAEFVLKGVTHFLPKIFSLEKDGVTTVKSEKKYPDHIITPNKARNM